MNTRRSIDAKAMLVMTFLCATWGFQQITLKLAAADITPTLQIGIRSACAAVLVGLLMRWRHEVFWTATTWRSGVAAGVLFGVEFLLLGQALLFTTASRAVVFLYCAPIFVALVLHYIVPAERLRPLQWLGILLAFSGVAVAFLGKSSPLANYPHQFWGDGLALLASMAWAATTIVVRSTKLASAPATQTLQYQLVVSAILIIGAAGLLGQWHINFTPIMWSSLVFQVVAVSFISYLAWFALLKQYIVSQLGVFSFLTPLFGVLAGVLILHEPLTINFVMGAVLVMLGIVLVSGHKWLGELITKFRNYEAINK